MESMLNGAGSTREQAAAAALAAAVMEYVDIWQGDYTRFLLVLAVVMALLFLYTLMVIGISYVVFTRAAAGGGRRALHETADYTDEAVGADNEAEPMAAAPQAAGEAAEADRPADTGGPRYPVGTPLTSLHVLTTSAGRRVHLDPNCQHLAALGARPPRTWAFCRTCCEGRVVFFPRDG